MTTTITPFPEMRPAAAGPTRWMGRVLDCIDYGVIVLARDLTVQYVNRRAERSMEGAYPIEVVDGRLHGRIAADERFLRAAAMNAADKDMRSMGRLTGNGTEVLVSVIPLARDDGKTVVLLLLGRDAQCMDLSVNGFARCHGLSQAEAAVLAGLADGLRASEIADMQRVAVSTVRTQLASIRSKTGTDSLQSLVRELGKLPPLMPVIDVPRAPSPRWVA